MQKNQRVLFNIIGENQTDYYGEIGGGFISAIRNLPSENWVLKSLEKLS